MYYQTKFKSFKSLDKFHNITLLFVLKYDKTPFVMFKRKYTIDHSNDSNRVKITKFNTFEYFFKESLFISYIICYCEFENSDEYLCQHKSTEIYINDHLFLSYSQFGSCYMTFKFSPKYTGECSNIFFITIALLTGLRNLSNHES